MSFDTTKGTWGARQPKGAFLRWTNTLVSRRIARKGKAPGMGFDALVLVTLGAKTGQERRTPLGWFPGDDGSWTVVAAAGGAPKNLLVLQPRCQPRPGLRRGTGRHGGRDRRATARCRAWEGVEPDPRGLSAVCHVPGEDRPRAARHPACEEVRGTSQTEKFGTQSGSELRPFAASGRRVHLTRIAFGFRLPGARITLAMFILGGHRPAFPAGNDPRISQKGLICA